MGRLCSQLSMIIFCVVGGWVMVPTSGRIKRHRYSFATLAAIRRASPIYFSTPDDLGREVCALIREFPAADIFGLAHLSDDVSTFRKAQKYSRETPKRSSTLPPPNSATRITS